MKRLAVICFSFFIFTTGYAQYTAPTPVTTTINTPYGPVNHTYYTPGMPMDYGTKGPTTAKYKYRIVLHNDSSLIVKTKIDFSDNPHILKFKVGKEKMALKPADTKELLIFDGGQRYGIPADSCWLFRTESGAINTYSFLPDAGNMAVMAIQDGDDAPIVALTEENVMALVGDSPKAIQLVEKKKLLKAVWTYNNERRKEENQ